jgi:hypothetical protein
MFSWFSSADCTEFGKTLASDLLRDLEAVQHKPGGKFAAKAEKALVRADQRVRDFKQQRKLNVFRKAKVANAFLWALKDAGISQGYSDQLTQWLSHRL